MELRVIYKCLLRALSVELDLLQVVGSIHSINYDIDTSQ